MYYMTIKAGTPTLFPSIPTSTIYEQDKTSLSNLHLIVQWCQLPTVTMSESLIQIPSFPNKTLKFPPKPFNDSDNLFSKNLLKKCLD